MCECLAGASQAKSDTRLAGMVQQVKEVLPHVPVDVIRRDLRTSNVGLFSHSDFCDRDAFVVERTFCVDTTVSNIVEGTIRFTPEPVPPAGRSSTSSSPVKAAVSDKRKRQSGRSPTVSHHHLTFEERKKAFIDEARR